MAIGDLSACRADVADAKESLRAWAAEADADLERKIEAAKSQAKRLAPWAAGIGGAAAVIGLFAGRGRRGDRAAGGGSGWVGTARRGIGLVTTAIGIARVAMPIVQDLMARRARKD